MIVNVIGVRRITGKADNGPYDYFKVGYTTPFPRGTDGATGELGGSCSLPARFFPNRVPHVGDRLVLDLDLKGRVQDAIFIEDIM